MYKSSHGKVVNSLLDGHFRTSLEILGYLGTLGPLFYEYCEFENTTIHLLFFACYIVEKYAYFDVATVMAQLFHWGIYTELQTWRGKKNMNIVSMN